MMTRNNKLEMEAMAQFLEKLKQKVDSSRLEKATSMLAASRFQLFSEVTERQMVGVVKSQSDPNLVYSCRLAATGEFACCTQNLNPCGGLRGKPCKHLLVLIVGLTLNGELDSTTIFDWLQKSAGNKPVLVKDLMAETFLRYQGAEAGDIDWRPTETIPEDFYAF